MKRWAGIEKMPRLYDALTGDGGSINKWRRMLLADVRGDVLELGAGTGHNLPFYAADVNLIATEYAPQNIIHAANKQLRLQTRFAAADAQALPFAAASFDHVVATLMLCSVSSQAAALGEIRRVLRPNGRLHLIEHTLSNNGLLNAALHALESPWCWAMGGCHPNRDTMQALHDHGWQLIAHRQASAGVLHMVVAQAQ